MNVARVAGVKTAVGSSNVIRFVSGKKIITPHFGNLLLLS
jgi:hypothetical protein